MSNFIALESDALRRIYNESVSDEVFNAKVIYYGAIVYACLLNFFSLFPFVVVYMQWVRPGTFELYQHLKEEPKGVIVKDVVFIASLCRLGWLYGIYWVTGFNTTYLTFTTHYHIFLYLIQKEFDVHKIFVLLEYNFRFRTLVYLMWASILSVFYDPMYLFWSIFNLIIHRYQEFFWKYDDFPQGDRHRISRAIEAVNLGPMVPVRVDWTRLW